MSKIALLFPGQGSQYVGMGRSLYEQFPAARLTFEEANDCLGFDLYRMCCEGSEEALTLTHNTQPAVLVASVAAFRVYMQEVGIAPAFSAGHSLGEYTALACAGAIRFADALRLVRRRGELMQGIDGAMAAIGGVAIDTVIDACEASSGPERIAAVSIYNSPGQCVISGHREAIAEASERLRQAGARIVPLKVSAPFHCMLMSDTAVQLEKELSAYEYGEMKWSVVSNVTARPYKHASEIVRHLTRQMVEPVLWHESVAYMVAQGMETGIEIGPKTVLRNLFREIAPGLQAYAYDKEEDREVLQQAIKHRVGPGSREGEGEVKPDRALFVAKCMRAAVCTRNANWNNAEYQQGVIEPYKKLQAMQESLDQQRSVPTDLQLKEAVELLVTLFETKRVPLDEQRELLEDIIQETGTGALALNPYPTGKAI
jgi:[acyl-carrier-protein] S-malonyltransferase